MPSTATVKLLAGLGLAVTTSAAVWMYKQRRWVEVGKVTDIFVYPIKSSAGTAVENARLTNYGLEAGELTDRSFVIMMTSATPWVHVTSAMAPMILSIKATVNKRVLTLARREGAPEQDVGPGTVTVKLDDVLKTEPVQFSFKSDPVTGLDCGDQVSHWLQETLYSKLEDGSRPTVRLMYVGSHAGGLRHATKVPFYDFEQHQQKDMQLFQDSSAFMITTEASLAALNSRLKEPIDMVQARPNIVVSGVEPFEEDYWAYVKIGNGTTLRTLKPRQACMRMYVRHDNYKKHTELEQVLKELRVPQMAPILQEKWVNSPLFGINVALDSNPQDSVINVGDKVWALKKKPKWLL